MVTDESLTIDQVADLTTKILSDVKHTNEITRLVDSLGDQPSDNLLVIALISALKKVGESLEYCVHFKYIIMNFQLTPLFSDLRFSPDKLLDV